MKVDLEIVAGPDAGRVFRFDRRARFIIGRAPTATLQITGDSYFSRHHTLLEINPPNVLLHDLQSTNGTLVNNVKADGPVLLRHGDTLGGGSVRLRLAIAEYEIPLANPPASTRPLEHPSLARSHARRTPLPQARP
jgi:pSer/pThr/pTyr-binding forkhead associated (FHA) protein